MHVFALQASEYGFSSPIGRTTGIKGKTGNFQLSFQDYRRKVDKPRKVQILYLYLQFKQSYSNDKVILPMSDH